MDAREFAEWIAYDKLDPIGDERMEYMHAQTAYVTAVANAGKKARRIKFSDFLPKHGPKPKKTQGQIEGTFRMIANAFKKNSGAGKDQKVP